MRVLDKGIETIGGTALVSGRFPLILLSEYMTLLQNQLMERREKIIKSELKRLKTNRMNIVVSVQKETWTSSGEYFTYHEKITVQRMLPPGPRPLP